MAQLAPVEPVEPVVDLEVLEPVVDAAVEVDALLLAVELELDTVEAALDAALEVDAMLLLATERVLEALPVAAETEPEVMPVDVAELRAVARAEELDERALAPDAEEDRDVVLVVLELEALELEVVELELATVLLPLDEEPVVIEVLRVPVEVLELIPPTAVAEEVAEAELEDARAEVAVLFDAAREVLPREEDVASVPPLAMPVEPTPVEELLQETEVVNAAVSAT